MNEMPGDIVRGFIGAMSSRDPDAVMKFASDDIVFENVPLPPPAGSVRGRAVVRRRLEVWMRASIRVEFTIQRQIEQGQVVMHERSDAIWFPAGMFPGEDHFVMPVMAVWEITDGRIRLWRDYYDTRVIPESLGVDLASFGRTLGESYVP